MTEFFIGRQPIFNASLEIEAYELLFRNADVAAAEFMDGDQASSQVINNTLLDLGLDQIVGKRTAFINMTRNLLLGNMPSMFPKDRVVLEVLEDIVIDDEMLKAITRLSKQGYRLALDDFLWREDLAALVPLVEIIKIDIRAMDRETLRDHARRLRGQSLTLLAEKVETAEEFALCRALGFELFQGYFLSRPDVVSGRRPPSNRHAVMELLQKAHDPEVTAAELERIISNNASLSYQTLRMVNSAAMGQRNPIESVHRAILLLGSSVIRNWISVLALARIEDKPSELLVTTIVRARMCEALAGMTDPKLKQSYFTVGLFSTMDELMQTPMQDVVAQLPMSAEVNGALLSQEGSMGQALARAISMEHASMEQTYDYLDLDEQTVSNAYLSAIAWGNAMRQELGL